MSTPIGFARVTDHFRLRAAQRRLRAEVLEFILLYGLVTYAADAVSYTVLPRFVPATTPLQLLAERACGWVVVESREGVLLTCYRRRDASRFLKRKQDVRRAA